MQPSNLIAVSIAAAVPVANALNHCDPRTRQETPTSIGEYLKVVQDAVDKIVDNKRPEATVSTRNGHVNGNYDVNCMSLVNHQPHTPYPFTNTE